MRILSWNACGDSSISDLKTIELSNVIEYWENMGDPIEIICLQEINAADGTLCEMLRSAGWLVVSAKEQANGGGRSQAIAVTPSATISFSAVIDLSGYMDPNGHTSRPCRNPLCAEISGLPCGDVTVITWHATLGSRQLEAIRGLSNHMDAMNDQKIILAGDLNCSMDYLNENNIFAKYEGYSHNLDHIIAKNVTLSDGIISSDSFSDHLMISAHVD